MEKPDRPTRAYLAELTWAFLLFNGIAAAVGAFVGWHMEDVVMGLALFLGGSVTVTLLLLLLVAATFAWDAWVRARLRRAGRRGSSDDGG